MSGNPGNGFDFVWPDPDCHDFDWPVGENAVVTVHTVQGEVVEFWRSDVSGGAVLEATKAGHHGASLVVHDYGPHVPGVEYWVAMSPSRSGFTHVLYGGRPQDSPR